MMTLLEWEIVLTLAVLGICQCSLKNLVVKTLGGKDYQKFTTEPPSKQKIGDFSPILWTYVERKTLVFYLRRISVLTAYLMSHDQLQLRSAPR